jgi:hypothetical protein
MKLTTYPSEEYYYKLRFLQSLSHCPPRQIHATTSPASTLVDPALLAIFTTTETILESKLSNYQTQTHQETASVNG